MGSLCTVFCTLCNQAVHPMRVGFATTEPFRCPELQPDDVVYFRGTPDYASHNQMECKPSTFADDLGAHPAADQGALYKTASVLCYRSRSALHTCAVPLQLKCVAHVQSVWHTAFWSCTWGICPGGLIPKRQMRWFSSCNLSSTLARTHSLEDSSTIERCTRPSRRSALLFQQPDAGTLPQAYDLDAPLLKAHHS